MKNYIIKCEECGAKRQVGIVQSSGRELIDWLDNNPNPQVTKIVSGRKRLDGNWGWACICGNDDIMTDQEKSEIENHQDPDPKNLAKVIKNLRPQVPRFEMRVV